MRGRRARRSIRLPAGLDEWLADRAAGRGVSWSEYVVDALKCHQVRVDEVQLELTSPAANSVRPQAKEVTP
jgi:hypothetical protein